MAAWELGGMHVSRKMGLKWFQFWLFLDHNSCSSFEKTDVVLMCNSERPCMVFSESAAGLHLLFLGFNIQDFKEFESSL